VFSPTHPWLWAEVFSSFHQCGVVCLLLCLYRMTSYIVEMHVAHRMLWCASVGGIQGEMQATFHYIPLPLEGLFPPFPPLLHRSVLQDLQVSSGPLSPRPSTVDGQVVTHFLTKPVRVVNVAQLCQQHENDNLSSLHAQLLVADFCNPTNPYSPDKFVKGRQLTTGNKVGLDLLVL